MPVWTSTIVAILVIRIDTRITTNSVNTGINSLSSGFLVQSLTRFYPQIEWKQEPSPLETYG